MTDLGIRDAESADLSRIREIMFGEPGPEWLSLDPALRGHGIGGRLLDVAEERARTLGAPRIVLTTTTSNHARHLYERKGYAVTRHGPTRPTSATRVPPAESSWRSRFGPELQIERHPHRDLVGECGPSVRCPDA